MNQWPFERVERGHVWRDEMRDIRMRSAHPAKLQHIVHGIQTGSESAVPYVVPVAPARHVPVTAKYRLVAGRDLLEAHDHLYGTEGFIQVRIVPMGTPEWEGLLLNIRQALRLGTLTTFERARAFHMLIGHGLKVVDIGRHLRDDGCAQSTVEVAVSTYSRLARPMLDLWRDEVITSTEARTYSRLYEPEQVAKASQILETALARAVGHQDPDFGDATEAEEGETAVRKRGRRALFPDRLTDAQTQRLVAGLRGGEPTSWSATEVKAILEFCDILLCGAAARERVGFELRVARGRPRAEARERASRTSEMRMRAESGAQDAGEEEFG